MAVTRIKNNQLTDGTINAAAKLQDFSVTSGKFANNLTYGSDFTITGNLTVQGNVTAIDTYDLVVEDPLILLAKDQTGTPTLDIGFIGERGDSDNIAFVWDESAGQFVAAFTTIGSGTTNTTITVDSYASMQVLNLTASDVDITGNLTFDGTITGNVTVTGNVDADNFNATTSVTAASAAVSGNITGNNLISNNDVTTATVSASGNVTADNLVSNNDVTTATVSASGNITGQNLISNANIDGVTVTASGDLEGNNAVITNDVSTATVSASGNVTADNLVSNNDVTTATVSASGNITGQNITSNANIDGVTVTASGDLEGNNAVITNDVSTATVSASGDITGQNLISNANVDGVTITASGNLEGNNAVITNNVSTATVSASGNITGQNITSNANIDGVTVTASGDLEGNNAVITNDVSTATVSASGNVTADNLVSNNDVTTATVSASGNITGQNITSNANIDGVTVTASGDLEGNNAVVTNNISADTIDATGNLTAGNITTTGVGQVGSLEVDNDALIAGNLTVQGNVTYVNVDDLRVEDPVIALGGGPNGESLTTDDGMDRGTKLLYYSTGNDQEQTAFFGWDNSSGNMLAAANVTVANNVVTVQDFGTLEGGNLYFANANITDTATIANLETSTISASGNITGGNLISNNDVTTATVSASGNVTAGNLISNNDVTTATVSASGNITGQNLISNANIDGVTITASGNLEGNNAVITNDVSTATITASGNITGQNLISNANIDGVTVTASGDLEGNNAVITNDVSTATVSASGDITGQNLISNANIDGVTVTASGDLEGNNAVITNDVTTATVSASGNVTADNLVSNNDVTTATVTASGNITGQNLISNANIDGVTVSASGNLEGNNAVVTNDTGSNTFTATTSVTTPSVTSTGALSITSGANANITLDPDGSGVVILEDETANRMLFTGVNKEIATAANATFDGANLSITGQLTVDNVVVDGQDITSSGTELTINDAGGDVDFRVEGDTDQNLLLVDAGTDTVLIGTSTTIAGAKLVVDSTESIVVPVGTTLERPSTAATGMLRFNTTSGQLEYYDNTAWVSAGTDFTVITADSFTGDGSTVAFTLSKDATTSSTIVSINGVVQIPVTAYSVSDNILTFTEAPVSSDVIDARILVTTDTVIGIVTGDETGIFEGAASGATFESTGNIVPSANVTYNLGSDTLRWNELYLAGTTITLGDIVIKDSGNGQIGFFGSDGSTPATIDSDNVDTTTISDGNSSVAVASTGGNVAVSVGGNANVGLFTTSGLTVTGAIEATNGFVGLDATTIEDGTSSVSVTASNGNVAVDVGGVANVGLFTTSGLTVTGNVAAGNVSGTTLSATTLDGTLSTAAQPNVTSVGTLTSLDVTGNVAAGNVSGTTVSATTLDAGNIEISGDTITSAHSTITIDPSTAGPGGLVVIDGNLQVTGTTTTIESTTVTIDDLAFNVANNAGTSSAANNGGLKVGPVGSEHATWLYSSSTSNWETSLGISATGNVDAGNVSATTGAFTTVTGAGSGLTSLNGTNISSGTVAAARIANLDASKITTGTLPVTRGGTGTTTSTGSGSVVLSTSPTFGTQITVPQIAKSGTDGVGNIGSSSNGFDTVFAKATSAQYADLAEMYEADQSIEPGTVVHFGGDKEVTVCDQDACARIAGVVSTDPSYLMNSHQPGEHVVAVALTGRVPVQVIGPVRKGDMMVSAGNGHARAESAPAMGTVIGKALEDFDGESGVIEVVVGRL